MEAVATTLSKLMLMKVLLEAETEMTVYLVATETVDYLVTQEMISSQAIGEVIPSQARV